MSHHHTPLCWSEYEPCGEHHKHDYNCGGGKLGPRCPDYVKPVFELIVKGRTPEKVVAYACETCGTVYATAQQARECYRCMTSRPCRACGKPTPSRSRLLCETCTMEETNRKFQRAQARAFNAAKKVSAAEYAQGPCDHVCTALWPDEDDYAEIGEQDPDLAWVWGCKPMPWPVPNIEDIVLDLMDQEFPEGSERHLTNLDELQDVVNAWFAAKEPSGYFQIDTETVVVLDPLNTPDRLVEPE